MSKLRIRQRSPKRMLALPDLEQSKAAVLNSLPSKSARGRVFPGIADILTAWHGPLKIVDTLVRNAASVSTPESATLLQIPSRA
jgi:hypothetical protein